MLSLKCQEFLPGTILIRRSLSFFEAIRDLGVRKVNLSDTEPVRSVRLTYWCDGTMSDSDFVCSGCSSFTRGSDYI